MVESREQDEASQHNLRKCFQSTAPPRPGSPQQSQRHSATKLRPGDPPRGQSAHRAQNGRSRMCAVVRGRNPKIETNTVPPPDPADKNTTQHDRTEQDRTGQDKTGQDRTRQDARSCSDTTPHDMTRHDTTRPDPTQHDRTGQDRKGRDKTGHDRTRQDRTRHDTPQHNMTKLSPRITTVQRRTDQALPTNHNGAAPPKPRSPQQSQQRVATQTKLSPAITTAQRPQTQLFPASTTPQRRPHQALPTNHNGTAPPRPGSPQQSQRRHPDHPLPSNHNGTAPPRPGSPQQSQRHRATQTRLSPAITTARRHTASPRRPPSRRILRVQRIGHKTVVRGRARTLAATIPKSERTRSRPQTPQTKTRTLRYAFGKN